MHTKPCIYSIIGPNGAGKSSSARLIADVEHFDFDAILVKDVQGKLEEWCQQKFKKQESFSLAHNFFPGYSSNDDIVIQACSEGYDHKVVYLGIRNVETCIRRVQLRTLKSHHFVQKEDIIVRYQKGLNQLNEWCRKTREGIKHRVNINEIRIVDYTADAEIVSIMDFKNGHLEILTQNDRLLSEWKKLVSEMFHQS